jgi:hypothetical protein
MEAAGSSEMSANLYQDTRRHIEEYNLNCVHEGHFTPGTHWIKTERASQPVRTLWLTEKSLPLPHGKPSRPERSLITSHFCIIIIITLTYERGLISGRGINQGPDDKYLHIGLHNNCVRNV